MNTQKNKNAGYLIIGFTYFLTIILIGKLIIKNIPAKPDLPLAGFILYAIFELIWLAAPYIVMIHFFKKQIFSSTYQQIFCYVLISTVSMTGLFMLIDIMFIHPDPQGPIAMLMVPLVQLCMYGLLSLISIAIGRNRER